MNKNLTERTQQITVLSPMTPCWMYFSQRAGSQVLVYVLFGSSSKVLKKGIIESKLKYVSSLIA